MTHTHAHTHTHTHAHTHTHTYTHTYTHTSTNIQSQLTQVYCYSCLYQASRDAIAKNLYDRLFRWTVNRINQLVAPTAEDLGKSVEIGILIHACSVLSALLGVLDVFGFEKLQTNNFEQLCINITSEHLYYFFNQVSVCIYL